MAIDILVAVQGIPRSNHKIYTSRPGGLEVYIYQLHI